MKQHNETEQVLMVLSAIQGKRKRPRDMTQQIFEVIREYLYRRCFIQRSVATGEYLMNDRGEVLIAKLKEAIAHEG
jgi:hypothetical protein